MCPWMASGAVKLIYRYFFMFSDIRNAPYWKTTRLVTSLWRHLKNCDHQTFLKYGLYAFIWSYAKLQVHSLAGSGNIAQNVKDGATLCPPLHPSDSLAYYFKNGAGKFVQAWRDSEASVSWVFPVGRVRLFLLWRVHTYIYRIWWVSFAIPRIIFPTWEKWYMVPMCCCSSVTKL